MIQEERGGWTVTYFSASCRVVKHDDFLHIHSLQTPPEDGGRGFATCVLNQVKALAQREGYKGITLTAAPFGYRTLTYEQVLNFYQDHGFRIVQVFRAVWDKHATAKMELRF